MEPSSENLKVEVDLSDGGTYEATIQTVTEEGIVVSFRENLKADEVVRIENVRLPPENILKDAEYKPGDLVQVYSKVNEGDLEAWWKANVILIKGDYYYLEFIDREGQDLVQNDHIRQLNTSDIFRKLTIKVPKNLREICEEENIHDDVIRHSGALAVIYSKKRSALIFVSTTEAIYKKVQLLAEKHIESLKQKLQIRKANQRHSYKETFYIPHDIVGLVIGAKGCNIKKAEKIEGVTSVKKVPSHAGGYQFKVYGETEEAVKKARSILEVCIERFQFPQEFAGLMVGKHGTNMDEIVTKSEVFKIKLFEDQADDVKLDIVGKPENIEAAKLLLNFQLNELKKEGISKRGAKHGEKHQDDETVSREDHQHNTVEEYSDEDERFYSESNRRGRGQRGGRYRGGRGRGGGSRGNQGRGSRGNSIRGATGSRERGGRGNSIRGAAGSSIRGDRHSSERDRRNSINSIGRRSSISKSRTSDTSSEDEHSQNYISEVTAFERVKESRENDGTGYLEDDNRRQRGGRCREHSGRGRGSRGNRGRGSNERGGRGSSERGRRNSVGRIERRKNSDTNSEDEHSQHYIDKLSPCEVVKQSRENDGTGYLDDSNRGGRGGRYRGNRGRGRGARRSRGAFRENCQSSVETDQTRKPCDPDVGSDHSTADDLSHNQDVRRHVKASRWKRRGRRSAGYNKSERPIVQEQNESSSSADDMEEFDFYKSAGSISKCQSSEIEEDLVKSFEKFNSVFQEKTVVKSEIDNVDEVQVLKELVQRFGSICRFGDFICWIAGSDLFKCDIREWFNTRAKKFHIYRKGQEIVHIAPFYRELNICKHFFDPAKPSHCENTSCDFFHVCRQFVRGRCNLEENCSLPHNFSSPENVNLKKKFLLGDFTDADIMVLLNWKFPRLCHDYIYKGGCTWGKGQEEENENSDDQSNENCPYLHYCKNNFFGKCNHGNQCKYNHSFDDLHNKWVLRSCHLSKPSEGSLKKMIFVPSCKENENSKEDESMEDTVQELLSGKVSRSGSRFMTYDPLQYASNKETSLVDDEKVSLDFDQINKNLDSTQTSKMEVVKDILLDEEAGTKHICISLSKKDCRKTKCKDLHVLEMVPYLWQIKLDETWVSFLSKDNLSIEQAFCSLDKSVKVKDIVYDDEKCSVDVYFGNHDTDMYGIIHQGYNNDVTCKVRRLSTASFGEKSRDGDSFVTQWRWYWKDNDGAWLTFKSDQDLQIYTLEVKYLKQQKSYLYARENYKMKYRLCFKSMEQVNLEYGTRREVIRRPLFVSSLDVQTKRYPPKIVSKAIKVYNELSRPDHFYPWDLANEFELIELDPTVDTEYTEVLNSFQKTMEQYRSEVKFIYRVQSRKLWSDYQTKKRHMHADTVQDDMPNNDIDERSLFHGTDTFDTCRGICINNFDFRKSGKNATVYGQGSYFARKASYSHHYTRPSNTGDRYMFRAKVLVGKFTLGKSEYRRPPEIPRQSHKLYDSCVDSENNPSIFVVFDRGQSYPEYLINYADKVHGPEDDSFTSLSNVSSIRRRSANRFSSTASSTSGVGYSKPQAATFTQPTLGQHYSMSNASGLPTSQTQAAAKYGSGSTSSQYYSSSSQVTQPVSQAPAHTSSQAQTVIQQHNQYRNPQSASSSNINQPSTTPSANFVRSSSYTPTIGQANQYGLSPSTYRHTPSGTSTYNMRSDSPPGITSRQQSLASSRSSAINSSPYSSGQQNLKKSSTERECIIL